MRLSVLLLVLASLLPKANAQGIGRPPVNDACQNAIQVKIGETLTHLTNANATVTGAETPQVQPITCIQTLENDMWFTFTTEAEYDHYSVTLLHNACSSPAGLQALLIRSDDCNSGNYQYMGCSNLITTDTIKLFLRDAVPGHRYLIYVDGYEGTVCDYTLQLEGQKGERVTLQDFRFIRNDYDTRSLPSWDPEDLQTSAGSNRVEMRWTGSNQEDIAFYVIEGMPASYQPGDSSYDFARVMGIVPSQGNVAGGAPSYSYSLYPTSEEARDYCYRIVKVSTKGEKQFTAPFCVHLVPVTSFYVSEVIRGASEGEYVVKYINRVKKEDFNLQVVDANQKVVKQAQLNDEPVRDGKVTLMMGGFPKGTYYLQMTNRKGESYVRQFEVF